MTVNKANRSVAEIVEEQVHRWQRGATSGVGPAVGRRPRPIITISRLHASGGVDLARNLAERLGFTFWHKELVREIATNANLSERLIKSFDERRRDGVAELVRNLTLVDRAPSSAEYVVALTRVLRWVGVLGGAVIVGRGAHYVLNPKDLLRVRLVAPVEDRVRNLVAKGLSAADATREIARVDRDRSDFVKGYFHHDVEDALDYDLVINLGRIPPEAATDLIVAATRARFADRL